MMKKLTSLLLVLCTVLSLVACGGTTPAPTTFAEGTTINGVAVSGQTPQEAAAALAAAAEGYTFTLKLGENTYTATGEELALAYDETADLQTLLDAQNADAALLALTAPVFTADVTALVDQVELTYAPVETVVPAAPVEGEVAEGETSEEVSDETADGAEGETADQSVQETVILVDPYAAKDAYLTFNESALKYEVVADVDGLKVDGAVVGELCLTAIASLTPELEIELDQFVVKAALVADSEAMTQALEKANAALDLQLTYTFTPKNGNTSSYTLSRAELGAIYYLDAADLTMKVDEERLGSLVSELDNKYSVAGETTKFKTTGGSYINISVATAGQSVDTEKLYNDMLDCLTKGVGGTRVAPYVTVSDSGNAQFGGSYVEVNLTSQHLWLYKNGVCIMSTPIVSGNVFNGTTTPTGNFRIFAKNRDRYLRGNNIDGTRYESWVSYFMPFSGGCGLHDATWRSVFGGTEYWFNGSHGCVGMTLEKAKILYNNVSVGTHVVVYGGISKSQLPTETPVITTEKEVYTIEVGQKIDLGITHNSDGRQWLNISAAGIVGIASDHEVVGLKEGIVAVGVYLDTTSNFMRTHKDVVVRVVPEGSLSVAQEVTATQNTNLLNVGGAAGQISFSGNQTAPVFTSSNTSVATVDDTGKVTPVGVGSVTITMTCPKTIGYKEYTTTFTFTVAAPVTTDKAISATVGTSELMMPGSTQITVAGAEGRTLTYVANADLVSVSADGKITVVKNPDVDTIVTVSITAAANGTYNKAETTVTVTVKHYDDNPGGGNQGGGSEGSGSSGGSTSTPGGSSSTPEGAGSQGGGSTSTPDGSGSQGGGSTSTPDGSGSTSTQDLGEGQE